MTTIRLSKEIEEKINYISQFERITKTEVIKNALKKYFENHEMFVSPHNAGKDFFGKHGSGESNNSLKYKQKVKKKINEKFTH